MGNDMNTQEALGLLKSGKDIQDNAFAILQAASHEVNNDPDSPLAKEMVLRALDHRTSFSHTELILYSLVREIGLFPYLEENTLSFRDAIAYEYHKPGALENIVFHQEQLPIFQKIMHGHNVVLSAPTSFGKSKIIDAVVAQQKFTSVVIVVPTLALIDETRRRLTRLFSATYNVVAHPSQAPSDGRNIFIFTPERVVAYREHFPKIDFFVVDEFYKIGGQNEEDHRVIALNEAFYLLYKEHGAQFYMLGPNIRAISEGAGERFNFEFISTDFNTVVVETIPVRAKDVEERYRKLVDICKVIDDSTLIYCKSIQQVCDVAECLVAADVNSNWHACDVDDFDLTFFPCPSLE